MADWDTRSQTIVVVGGGTSGCETGTWRPHAVGEGGFLRGGQAIGPCVGNNWLTSG